jgi:hypothetical protein
MLRHMYDRGLGRRTISYSAGQQACRIALRSVRHGAGAARPLFAWSHATDLSRAIPAEQRRAVEEVKKLLLGPKWTEIEEVAQRPN